jgi:hypothetical protein
MYSVRHNKVDRTLGNLEALGGFIGGVIVASQYNGETGKLYEKINFLNPHEENPVEKAQKISWILKESQKIVKENTDGQELYNGRYIYCYSPEFWDWFKDKVCEWECEPEKRETVNLCKCKDAPYMSNFEKLLHYYSGEYLLPDSGMINNVMKTMRLSDRELFYVQTAYFLITRKMYSYMADCVEEQWNEELDVFNNN